MRGFDEIIYDDEYFASNYFIFSDDIITATIHLIIMRITLECY